MQKGRIGAEHRPLAPPKKKPRLARLKGFEEVR